DKKPQQIESFTDERSEGQPLYVGVLVDTSPSAIAKLKFAQEAAMNFLHTVLRPRQDKAALITFDHEIILRQDFTDQLDLVDWAMKNLKKPGTRTALYDAVWEFCNELMRGVVGRRTLVVISDGDDTYSRATLREAIDIAQITETTIFAISTKAGFSGAVPGMEAGQVAGEGDRALMKLCEETGGRAFFTGDSDALEQSFTKIATEVRSQYVVTYKPTNDRYDGRFRRIEVKLARGGDGIKVHAKRGYSAQSDSAPPR
ncbi:MAG: VWA domain-containing protein, partial [Acidobacteriota bacterium]|nr:VWA domain-containing protein [Acidobacteriota bacterium]